MNNDQGLVVARRKHWSNVIHQELSARAASRLLSLLDHLNDHILFEDKPVSSLGRRHHAFFVRFLKKASHALQKDLLLFDLRLEWNEVSLLLEGRKSAEFASGNKEKEKGVVVFIRHSISMEAKEYGGDASTITNGGECLDEEDRLWLIETIEAKLQHKNVFDYERLNVEVLKSAIKVLSFVQEQTGYVLDTKKVVHGEKLHIEPDDENIEFTAEHQWNYSASSSGVVLFPDANLFTDEHWKYWKEVRTSHKVGSRRLFRDYEFRVITLFHEVIHCFQGHKWVFEDFKLWQAEFEASYSQLDLLHLAANVVDTDNEIWRDGFAEESMLWLFDLVREIHALIKEETCDSKKELLIGYEAWVSSHGRISPVSQSSDELFEQNKSHNTYLKCRLPLEVFSEGQQLVSYFKYRWCADLSTKDTYNMGHQVPHDLISAFSFDQ